MAAIIEIGRSLCTKASNAATRLSPNSLSIVVEQTPVLQVLALAQKRTGERLSIWSKAVPDSGSSLAENARIHTLGIVTRLLTENHFLGLGAVSQGPSEMVS
jgi:hypothetical protein